MFIHLKDLAAKGSIRLEGQEDLSGLIAVSGDLLSFGQLQVQLEARSVEGAADVDGELAMDVEQSCSRCLTPVKTHVTVPFHETFVKGEEKAIDEETDEDDEDAVLYVSEDRIDLKPYLAESVMLSLPFVPLCRKDCKGLCPSCGADRNERECGCKTDKVDPRLAGLANFFKQE